MTTRCPAISARRSRRIISSLLPENIGPQITSSQPPLLGGIRITRRDHRNAEDDPSVAQSRIRFRGSATRERLNAFPTPLKAA